VENVASPATLCHKLFAALNFFLTSLLHALGQHLVTRTKNCLSWAPPAPSSIRARPVPATTPQMRYPQPAWVTRPAQDSTAETRFLCVLVYVGVKKRKRPLKTETQQQRVRAKIAAGCLHPKETQADTAENITRAEDA